MSSFIQELRSAHDMAQLQQVALRCQSCGLRQTCKGVVFGQGPVDARLMVIGEGPGADEDRLGLPFVGKAGQLLDRILAAGGFDRSRNVYIANVVKCRPPGNRTPLPEERDACLPILREQFRRLRPPVVMLLGATAVQAIISPDARITQSRGQWVQKGGVWFLPTYHPAALLRNPELKKDVWNDLQMVIAKYRELINPEHGSVS